MNQRLASARVPPPGRILVREYEARGWTQKDLAEITGRPIQTINEIVQAKKQITPERAIELAEAFETSAEFWTNLEINYRLHQARKEKRKHEIGRKSKLYSLAPISELVKRGWLPVTDSLEELEKQVCDFLGLLRLMSRQSSRLIFAVLKNAVQRRSLSWLGLSRWSGWQGSKR